MKKLSILPTLIVLVIGGVFAGTQFLPPSSTDFPSMPKGQGTIGYILDLFDTDGTARNTERLGGVTASGYLQNNLCYPTKVWTGIDEHGKAICGTRTPLLVGNFTEGSMSVKRGTDNQRPLALNEDIQEGDLLITDSSQTGTIQFKNDASYIRLANSTTVEIRTGTLGSNTVAEAILADGQLWGRIMTSTGVNLGGGGLVAGVRGTSVAIGYNHSTSQVSISVIDSTKSDAATITNTKTNQSIIVDAGSIVTEQSGSTLPPTEETSITKVSLLTGNAWARKNTLEDIKYLAQKLESNTTPENSKQRVEQEITSATPSATDELRALLSTTTSIVGTTDSAANEIITEENEDKNDVNGEYSKKTDPQKSIIKTKRIACKQEGKRYWVTTNECEDNKLIAFLRTTDNVLISKNKTLSKNNNYFNISGMSMNNKTISVVCTQNITCITILMPSDISDRNNPIELGNNDSKKINSLYSYIEINNNNIKSMEIRD